MSKSEVIQNENNQKISENKSKENDQLSIGIVSTADTYSFCDEVLPDVISHEEQEIHQYLNELGLNQIVVKDMLQNRINTTFKFNADFSTKSESRVAPRLSLL